MLLETSACIEPQLIAWRPPVRRRHLHPVVDRPAPAHPQQAPGGSDRPSTQWIARLGQALVEVLSGERPAAYVARWVSPALVEGFRSDHGGRRLKGARLHSIRTQQISECAIEVSLVVRGERRSHAVALRLQRHHQRWRCTTLLVV